MFGCFNLWFSCKQPLLLQARQKGNRAKGQQGKREKGKKGKRAQGQKGTRGCIFLFFFFFIFILKLRPKLKPKNNNNDLLPVAICALAKKQGFYKSQTRDENVFI